MLRACKYVGLCAFTLFCWFLLSFHVIVQDGHVCDAGGSGIYVSCMKIPGFFAGDYLPSYDGLAFPEYVLSDSTFHDGQSVRVIRLASWWSFWLNIQNARSSGHDAFLSMGMVPDLQYVWEPALVLPTD